MKDLLATPAGWRLGVVSQFELQVVKRGDRLERLAQLMAAAPMIPKNAPVLEASDGVFDACSPTAMAAPCSVTKDTTTAEHRDDQLVDPTVGTICEYAAVVLTQKLDLGATVVHAVVAIARFSGLGREHAKVRTAGEDLGVA
jgi:hypothetical protein